MCYVVDLREMSVKLMDNVLAENYQYIFFFFFK